jgi:hypothetical protein
MSVSFDLKKSNYRRMNTTKLILFLAVFAFLGSCQKYDNINPNVPGENSIIPPSMLLNRVEFEMFDGPGLVDGQSGSITEMPFGTFGSNIWHYSQFLISNDTYYGGLNTYAWSSTAHTYNMLKNIIEMENAASKITKTTTNAYAVMGKFLRAYSFIWLTQRVGDIPMSQAGKGLVNPTPVYDTQHDVYKTCLALLDTANIMVNQIISDNGAAEGLGVLPFTGDIFGFNGGTNGINGLKQWQKVINAYKLRVLISLSKKANAGDATDLNIAAQFNSIVSNPATYPLLTSNSDNLIFTYNASNNPYPTIVSTNKNYANRQPLCSTLLSLMDSTQDPRTFVIATPSYNQVKNKGKNVNDFKAYVGEHIDSTITYLWTEEGLNNSSFVNFHRYYTTSVGPAPGLPTSGDESKGTIIIGYPEMCFNIAEGMNRGWTSGTTSTYYMNGINASMKYFGVVDGDTLPSYDVTGSVYLGKVTFQLNNFLTSSKIMLSGDASDLQKIVTQKYIAFWMNSGWEAFYNWRRTGYPSNFVSVNSLLNPKGQVPRRWQYPNSEVNYNTANYQAALKSQFGGTDDLFQDVWINK